MYYLIGDKVKILSKRVSIYFGAIGIIKSISNDKVDYPICIEINNPYYPNSTYKIKHNYNKQEIVKIFS
jgi:hypothetical protein